MDFPIKNIDSQAVCFCNPDQIIELFEIQNLANSYDIKKSFYRITLHNHHYST